MFMLVDRTGIYLCLVIIQTFFAQTFCFTRISLKAAENETEIDIKVSDHLSEKSARERRSEDDFPHELTIEIPLNEDIVELKLTRNRHISHDVPLTVERDGNIIQHNMQKDQDIGYYFDVTNGSSFMIQHSKRSEFRFDFFGTFHVGQKVYVVQPPDDNYKMHTIVQAPAMRIHHDDDIYRPHRETDENVKLRSKLNKRSITRSITYEVELLMVLDFSVYTFWKDRAAGSTHTEKDLNAKKNLRQYYALLLNAMDLRYKSVSGRGFVIKLLFAGLHISDTPAGAPWTEKIKDSAFHRPKVNSSVALTNFKVWENQQKRNLPGHDHAMLITKYDLESAGSHDNLGKAYVGGLCDEWQVSVIEDTFEATTATTAAHELGHNLNSEHDGEGNSCTEGDGYIMDAVMEVGNDTIFNQRLWIFSRCSLDYFDAFIKDLNRQHSNCMSTRSPSYNPSALNPFASDLLGQIYPPDVQCEAINGNGSYMCRQSLDFDYKRLCGDMDCSMLENNGSCWVQIPWEGTSCGNGKICRKGACVASPLAPSTHKPETCLFGDQPGHVAKHGKSCHDLINVESHHFQCYDYEEECCDTCASVKAIYTNLTDCRYGDKAIWCANLTSRECYLNANNCCSYCKKFYTGRPDCLYGDKENWCDTLMAHECYKNDAKCCQKCKEFETGTTGCKYGDMASDCGTLVGWQCYVNNETCCSHCKQFDTGRSDCRYGDKASWCSTLTSDECYNNDDNCCSLCKQFHTGVSGCEYGDRNPTCDASQCATYDQHTQNVVCCSSCSKNPISSIVG